MEESATPLLSLTVTFKDVGRAPHSIPDAVLERLGTDVAEATIRHFRPESAKKRESAKENEKKIVVLTDDERQQALISAKTAFEQHRKFPFPGDDAQKALVEAEDLMLKCISRDYGPTAVKSLHPIMTFAPVITKT